MHAVSSYDAYYMMLTLYVNVLTYICAGSMIKKKDDARE